MGTVSKFNSVQMGGVITGWGGRDRLEGGQDKDRLIRRSGDDRLNRSKGHDSSPGGIGATP